MNITEDSKEVSESIHSWLDECPQDTEIIAEFDNSIYVKVENPFRIVENP